MFDIEALKFSESVLQPQLGIGNGCRRARNLWAKGNVTYKVDRILYYATLSPTLATYDIISINAKRTAEQCVPGQETKNDPDRERK